MKKSYENYHVLNLENDTTSPLVESEKGGFGERKRWRVVKRFYWNLIFFVCFINFVIKSHVENLSNC